ncbi:transposase [Comamonadaceae bacterium G21597-S1]|nr:transposase [Comamonadaceae bacterium G21597-S1]
MHWPSGIRKSIAKPSWDELHVWLQLERQRLPDGTTTAKAIDYTLRRWEALTRCLQDGNVTVDNNHIENLMRPWAMGRKTWLFAGSEMGGERAATMMSSLQSAKLNGYEPLAYLTDILTRLSSYPNNRIEELSPIAGLCRIERRRPRGATARRLPLWCPLTRYGSRSV